jgi:hypothetical protein
LDLVMVSAGTITNGGALLPRSPYAADLAIARPTSYARSMTSANVCPPLAMSSASGSSRSSVTSFVLVAPLARSAASTPSPGGWANMT